MMHRAWDDGAIADLFNGWLPPQKTTKTRCGKRVSMAHIDNQHTTCDACLADVRRQEEGLATLLALYEAAMKNADAGE